MDEITDFHGQTQTDDPAARFVALVGERVREARTRKGMARRVLSELSGVSQRYLAQLENGDGNISIALLYRVAQALDHRIEWLVSGEDAWELAPLIERFRRASSAQRAQALAILDPAPADEQRRQRICLIGLRGAGKSTLGRLVGADLGLPFTELNRDIEEQSGMPIAEVMALYGAEGYRRLERQALERIVATTDRGILAVAGGIVAEPETFAFLMRHFHSIWIKATAEEHMARVRSQGDLRPMAGNSRAMDDLRALLKSREALYAQAQQSLDTSGQSVEESRAALKAMIARLIDVSPA